MDIRKIQVFSEEVYTDAGRPCAPPLKKVAVVAVVQNLYAGQPYTDDLSAHVDASVALGERIATLAAAAIEPEPIASYGKAAIVGTAGEQEHGVALLTTVYGNVLRKAAGGGKAWISSATKRGAPGSTIDIPLAHKDALYVRSHYDAMTITVHDAPLPDEIAVICCFASRGRPNHRVGGLDAAAIEGQDGLR